MGVRRISVLLAAHGVMLGAAMLSTDASASPSPAIPDVPEAALFVGVAEPWRTYLTKAREAERIEDPLQRCLAFPDLPANHWPGTIHGLQIVT